MTEQTAKALMTMTTNHLRQTRRAYYTGMRGVTYEDMHAAATRVLESRRTYERVSGRPVKTSVSKKAVATLLRSSL